MSEEYPGSHIHKWELSSFQVSYNAFVCTVSGCGAKKRVYETGNSNVTEDYRDKDYSPRGTAFRKSDD